MDNELEKPIRDQVIINRNNVLALHEALKIERMRIDNLLKDIIGMRNKVTVQDQEIAQLKQQLIVMTYSSLGGSATKRSEEN